MIRTSFVSPVLAAFAIVLSSVEEVAAEETAAPAAAPEAKPEQPKRPKKKPEYSNWDEAVAVATAWEQPIVAFIELGGGDKVSSKVKSATFGKQELVKDFLYKNAVYYHITVPAKKEKRTNNNNQRQKKDKNARPAPDMTAVKESERRPVSRLVGEPPFLPCIALAAPTGRVLAEGGISIDEDSPTPMTSLMKSFKSAFESGKFTFTESAKVQKLVAAEEKKAAAAAKRNKGKKE